jgi:chemotaxis regulatin CheY-phosphate phosphatase CheZ
VLIFGQLVRAIEEVIQIKEAPVSTVLVINASKARYMKMNRNVTNLEQGLIMNRQVLEGVRNLDI